METDGPASKFDTRDVFSQIKYTESVNMRIDEYRKTSNYQQLLAAEIFKEEVIVPNIPESVIRPKKQVRETYKQVIDEVLNEAEEGPEDGSSTRQKEGSGLIGVSTGREKERKSNQLSAREAEKKESEKGRKSAYEFADFGLMDIVEGSKIKNQNEEDVGREVCASSSQNVEDDVSDAVSEDMMVQNAIETEFGLVKVEGGVALLKDPSQVKGRENTGQRAEKGVVGENGGVGPVEVIIQNEEVFLRKKDTPRRETIQNNAESRNFDGEVNTTLIQLARDLEGEVRIYICVSI